METKSELEGVIELLGDLVLILPEEEIKTESGIVIQTASEGHEKRRAGIVKAAGPGTITVVDGRVIGQPMQVKVGHRVIFDWAVGSRHMLNGVDYLLMHQKDIAGIVAPNAFVGVGWRP